MIKLSPTEALENANAAAAAAREAAISAHDAASAARSYADQIAARAGDLVTHVSASVGVDPFVFFLSVFVMSIFVGYYVVWSVTPSLHTPLMAVTNAISSVIVVGALLAVSVDLMQGNDNLMAQIFGFLALVFSSVNIFSGFLVTNRMLSMYKQKVSKRG